MIVADRREGGINVPTDAPDGVPAFLRSLDRNVSLGVKLILPAIFITLIGTTGFGLFEAQQTNQQVEQTYETTAATASQAAAAAFYGSADVNPYLADLASALPGVRGIWILYLASPGTPVVASSRAGDLGLTGLADAGDVASAEAGVTTQEHRRIDGQDVLETVGPVRGNAYAVVVMTSLTGEDQVFRSKVIGSLIIGTLICALEIAAMVAILTTGVFRRIERIAIALERLGDSRGFGRLREGSEPAGRDALFNLARRVDRRLHALVQHERAEHVVSELGRLALEGTEPAELTRRALEMTRQAGNLQECYVVDARGVVTVIDSSTAEVTSEAKLPIWLGALARAAVQGRRPVLSASLGTASRYWDDNSGAATGNAAFIPLAGNPEPIGVMVGVTGPGGEVSAVTVAMMEAVATALAESLQRTSAETARHESEAKSKALFTVSHEIRNPLNALLGFTDLLLSGAAGPLSEKQENYMRKVDDGGRRLLRLVNDYLDLAKVMRGSLEVQTQAVMVAPEVGAVVDLLRPTADAKGVVVHSQVEPDAVARADRDRLRQVLMNLVSNAIKYTPAGGHVRVEVAGGSNGVRISVIDTGVGIPAGRQHLVFTEFANAGNYKGDGAGFGLALSRHLVEAMGGFIRFTSAEGAGTIFDVWLPGEQSPVAAGAEPADATQGVA